MNECDVEVKEHYFCLLLNRNLKPLGYIKVSERGYKRDRAAEESVRRLQYPVNRPSNIGGGRGVLVRGRANV